MLYDAIKKLVQYGINTGITPEEFIQRIFFWICSTKITMKMLTVI
jgi:hypothetical protein